MKRRRLSDTDIIGNRARCRRVLGSLSKLVAAIQSAVASAMEQTGDLVNCAIKTNANMRSVRLLTRSPLLKQAPAGERVKIVAALYKLETGARTIGL